MKLSEILREGDVIKAEFGKRKGVEKDTGIEIPKGYDRFELDGKKIIGIKGDKKTVVSNVSDVALGRELVKTYNNGGKSDSGIKQVSMLQAFGSPELNALHDVGIKLTEKPSYWEDFEGDGYAAKNNIHQLALKKAERAAGKFKVYKGADLFDAKNGSDKPRGPLVKPSFMPTENMFIVHFAFDDSRYLCDTTGANTYIRNWQKIV